MSYDPLLPSSLQCPNCGFANLAFASFCISCGEPLFEAPEITVEQGSEQLASLNAVPGKSAGHASSILNLPALKSARWEAIIGLFILLLVSGYALYDWQHKASQSDAYRRGIQAEQRKDWDQASEAFAHAGDWHDASQRKQVALQRVQERDRLYDEAATAESHTNFALALSDLQKVQAIQPSYRDSDQRLAKLKTQALNQRLDGVIYLVQDGAGPGLYIRDAQGNAHLLPGSDKNSTIHAISSVDNAFVYDRAGQELDYQSSSLRDDPAARDPLGQGRPDRVPVLAKLDPSGVLTIIALPELDSAGTGVFAKDGLWWYSSQPSKGSFGYEVFFMSHYAPFSEDITRVSDIQAGKRVAAVDPPRSRVVIAETLGEPRSPLQKTRLYLTDAKGHNERLLQTVEGEVMNVSVSGDGRWLLYIAQQNGASLHQAVWVVSLDAPQSGGSEQADTARQLYMVSSTGAPMSAHLSATFLLLAGAPDRVVVSRSGGLNSEEVVVYNVDDGRAYFRRTVASDGTILPDLAGISPDGAYLAYRWKQGSKNTVQLLNLAGAAAVTSEGRLPDFPGQLARIQVTPHADYVLADLFNPDGINHGISQSVYSFRITKEGKVGSGALIATPNMPYLQEYPALALPPGGSLLAYVTPGKELHAVGYDGTGDTLLAQGVGAVWSLWSDSGLRWWR